MLQAELLNLEKQLKGRMVLRADTVINMGETVDLLMSPSTRQITGLLIKSPEDRQYVIQVGEFYLYQNTKAVIATNEPVRFGEFMDAHPDNIRIGKQVLGASVVTRDGKLLGEVFEAYVECAKLRMIYRVTKTIWQKWFGGGVYIPDNVPYAWLPLMQRLMVPVDTGKRLAFTSLVQAVKAGMSANRYSTGQMGGD